MTIISITQYFGPGPGGKDNFNGNFALAGLRVKQLKALRNALSTTVDTLEGVRDVTEELALLRFLNECDLDAWG